MDLHCPHVVVKRHVGALLVLHTAELDARAKQCVRGEGIYASAWRGPPSIGWPNVDSVAFGSNFMPSGSTCSASKSGF